MTDEWLDRRLKVVDERVAPDPLFAARLYGELAAELEHDRLADAGAPRLPRETARRPSTRGRSRRWPGLLLVAALALSGAAAAAVSVGGLVNRAQQDDARHPTKDRLSEIVGSGRIRIAVRPDAPEVSAIGGGSASGFDVDVAREVGRRLGVAVDIALVPVDQMLAPSGSPGWDLAMAATGLPSNLTGAVQSAPYYYWPIAVVVPIGSPAASLGDLQGQTFCVVSGSTGAAWLAGTFAGRSATPALAPPGRVTTASEPTDAACLVDLAAGRVAAAVTARFSPGDIAVHGAVRTLGGPVITEERTVIAPSGGSDPSALVVRVGDVIAAMRSDGTLVDFSRHRFGGGDLTVAPTP